MAKKDFSAPNDNLVKIISNSAIIVSIVLLANILYNGLTTDTIGLGLVIPIVLTTWIIHPLGYTLNENGLNIKRLIGNVIIPYQNITDVGYISNEELGRSTRLFACGGLFGYFGTYISQNMGKYTMWCTNKDNMVVIIDKTEKTIIISPSDPDALISLIMDNLSSS